MSTQTSVYNCKQIKTTLSDNFYNLYIDHTHARARLAPQISGWDLARSRVFSQRDTYNNTSPP